MKKYKVTLTEEEWSKLKTITSKGSHRSQKVLNALILLNCDECKFQDARSINEVVSSVLQVSMKKIDRVKKRFVEEGFDVVLKSRNRAECSYPTVFEQENRPDLRGQNRGTYGLHYTNPYGKKRRLSVGKDYQNAQRLAVKFSDWLLVGKDPEHELERAKQTEKAKDITIRKFFPKFMEQHGSLQSKKMQDSYYSSFKNICRCPTISESTIDSIYKRHILEYMHLRMNKDGVTVKLCL